MHVGGDRCAGRMGGECHMNPFEYAVLKVVPRVERGEAINVGVVVIARAERYLRGTRASTRPRRESYALVLLTAQTSTSQ